MNTTRNIGALLGASAFLLLLAGCGGDVKQLQQENAALRAEVEALRASSAEAEAARAAESKRLQADAQDVARLRGEVTRLRTTAKDAEELRRENQLLKADNQKLRNAARVGPAPAPDDPSPTTALGNFPRESWSLAGYTSPESALVSAIWSMQQGNPKQYFESLTP